MRSFQLFITSVVLFYASIITTFGAEFFRKQTGTATMAGTSTTVTITSVDISKSFLVFSSTLDANQPQYYQIGGGITNATTLTFAREGGTGTVSISWQVFEFESGVSVQHGSTSGVARGAPVNVAINCVDLTKSFVIISAQKSGSTFGADDGITANLTTSTNMELMISNAGPGGADMEVAYWQVIEYQAATVKKLTTTLSAGSASTTSTITPAIGTLSKAFVISNHWFNGNANPDDLPRTELTNASTVTYTRVGTTTDMNFVTYVVEFNDMSTVTRGTQSFTSGTLLQNVSVTTSASSGVIASGNYGRQGSTSFSTDDNTGHGWFTYEITSPTNLQITRAVGTGSTADAPWQIVTFEDTGLQQSTFYSLLTGPTAWESNTAWSFTPDGSSGAVPSGVYPRRTNNVVIQNGHNITINNVNDNGPCSQSPANLGRSNVGAFTGSTDQMFYHTGDILIANGGTLTSSEEVMVEGYTLVENGGTFTITEDIVNLGYFEIATTANFTNTDDLILSGNSITIIDNTSFGADDIYIDHTDATLCGDGIMNLGNGGADPTIQFFNGGSLAQVCSSFTVTCTSNCGAFPITPTGNFISGNIGPGGVGNSNNNQLWLKADDLGLANGAAVTSWADASGNALTAASSGVAAEEPTFNTNAVNTTLPSISFDGGDFLNLGTPASLNLIPGTDSWSFFIVYNVAGAMPQGTFFSKATATGGTRQYQYTIDDNAGTSRFSSSIGGTLTIGSVVATNAWFVSSHTNNTTQKDSWTNEASDFVGSGIGAGQVQTAEVLIGARRGAGPTTGTGFLLTGDIAEIAMYDLEVNAAQRIIIDNYMAAKYDIDISGSGNDIYTMDNAGNGNYDFEAAGIGQAADGSNYRDARGTDIVRMWNPNGLDNSEFLMWGHDNTVITSTTTASPADVDGTVIEERLSRIWRVSESGGDVGTVSLSFDFNSIGGSPLGSNLRLLIDRDGDGFGDNDVTPIVGSVSAGIAVFSNVNFQDGDHFTLGNTDASVPLPIELLIFEAKPASDLVLINWTTASELNNDHFMVQRSRNAEEWEDVVKIKGAGTVSEQKNYQAVDPQPYQGESYYRLKQSDFDGTISFSRIERVSFIGIPSLVVNPNPSSGIFRVSGVGSTAPSQIRVYNAVGQLITPELRSDNTEVLIDLNSYPPGVYILQIAEGALLRSVRIIKS